MARPARAPLVTMTSSGSVGSAALGVARGEGLTQRGQPERVVAGAAEVARQLGDGRLVRRHRAGRRRHRRTREVDDLAVGEVGRGQSTPPGGDPPASPGRPTTLPEPWREVR